MADKSGIQTHLQEMSILANFKELMQKNLQLLRNKCAGDHDESIEEDDQTCVVYHVAPPPRKRPCIV